MIMRWITNGPVCIRPGLPCREPVACPCFLRRQLTAPIMPSICRVPSLSSPEILAVGTDQESVSIAGDIQDFGGILGIHPFAYKLGAPALNTQPPGRPEASLTEQFSGLDVSYFLQILNCVAPSAGSFAIQVCSSWLFAMYCS